MLSGGIGVGSNSSTGVEGVDTSWDCGVSDVCSSLPSSVLCFCSPYLQGCALCIMSTLSVSDDEYVADLTKRVSCGRLDS